tara:strand:- start:249 stop:704 length:456 start_codon:yes stop_codon:yes gene_type:complete
MGISRPVEVLTGSTDFYTVYTLIDITDSGIVSPKVDAKGFFQAQNLNTFIQSISLRSQPVLSSVEMLSAENLSNHQFGSNFTGIHNIWVLKFASETRDAWRKDNDNVYLLKQDFDTMPIHITLDETAVINPESVDTSTVNKNTYFKFSENI